MRLRAVDAWAHDPERRMDAVSAYVAAQDEIDPATPEGTRRIAFLLANVPQVRDAFDAVEKLFARAADTCPEPDVADRALVAAGSIARVRGDSDVAYWRLREALRRCRGTGRGPELSACVNLAGLLASDGRMAEAFVVAGRAQRLGAEMGAHRAAAHSGETRAVALRDFGLYEAAHAELDRAEHEARLEPDAAISMVIVATRLDVLWQSGRPQEALDLLDAVLDLVGQPNDADAAKWAMFRAFVLIDLGRPEEARDAVAPHRAQLMSPPSRHLRAQALHATIALALGDCAAALSFAAAALDDATALVDTPGGHRFQAEKLLPIFAACGAESEEARTIDLLAAERLRHIADIDRTARDIPEVAEIHADDRPVLVAGRKSFVAAHARVLDAIAERLVRGAGDATATLLLAPGDDDHVRMCAWCARLLARDGRWLPLGHLIPSRGAVRGAVRVTHGMCPDCHADLRKPGADSTNS